MTFRLPRDAQLVRFPAADGVELEGRLTPRAADRGVVLCHPHPLYGGTMLTPVILTVEQAFQEAGYTTLAFNFRGVGGSQGAHDGGRAETGDVAGALARLGEALGGATAVRAIAGYSFGSAVGGQVAAASRETSWYLGIAPPLGRYGFDFLASATCRVALVAGRQDEFGDLERLERLVASLEPTAWLRLLDTDHFFTDALDELAAACRSAIVWADEGRRS